VFQRREQEIAEIRRDQEIANAAADRQRSEQIQGQIRAAEATLSEDGSSAL
jgi:hypothetical protein